MWYGTHPKLPKEIIKKLLPPASCKHCIYFFSVAIGSSPYEWSCKNEKCQRCGIPLWETLDKLNKETNMAEEKPTEYRLIDFVTELAENGCPMCTNCIFFDNRVFKAKDNTVIGSSAPAIYMTVEKSKTNSGFCKENSPSPIGGWPNIPDGSIVWCGKYKTLRQV